MFLRYYLDLPMRFEDAEQALGAIPAGLAREIAEATGDQAERVLTEVGFTLAERRIGRRVEITLGAPYRLGSKAAVPFTWAPTRLRGLLPELEGDLEVAPIGPNRTQLAIGAMYAPPLGSVGEVIDRTLLHRVAELTVKDFLERVAEAMQAARRNPLLLLGRSAAR